MRTAIRQQASDTRSRPFEEVVAPHVRSLHAAALAILHSDDLAWDAVQETLFRAWRYGSLPEEPRALLLTLVRRSCLHILRCSRRRADHEYLAAASDHRRCCSMDPVGVAGDPAASAGIQDEIGLAAAATEKLTREHREVLGLVAWRGLSYREAAGALGIPLGTVRSRASRARLALQEILDETGTGASRC